MATIRKRGSKWQVQVRIKGCFSVNRSFLSKQNAQIWARQIEAEADRRGLPMDRRILDTLSLKDLLIRYRDNVIPKKKGRAVETAIVDAFMRHPIASLALSEIIPTHFAAYRDLRLKTVKPSTLIRQLGVLSHAYETARKEWGIPIVENPVRAISKPRAGTGRTRRLTAGEYEKIMLSCNQCRNRLIPSLIIFALQTGMRRGEILSAKWSDLDSEAQLLHIPTAKNGHARTIPLSKAAVATLELPPPGDRSPQSLIFPISTEAAKLAWQRLIKRANIDDLHFHDLRHEAISRFFERGLSIPEVALISGHRDMRMLFRYTHLKPQDIVLKLG